MVNVTKSPPLTGLRFLNEEQASLIAAEYDSPVFVYSEKELLARASEMLAFAAPYGLTVRYAMKANPLSAILKTFDRVGIHIDASSGYEAERAIKAGIKPSHIMITSQELPRNLESLVKDGVKFNACSLYQLESFGKLFPNSKVAIRINAGVGSGYRPQVSVAGPTASFGIWHEHLDRAQSIANTFGLEITTIHSHIGCGVDPLVWREVAKLTLKLVEDFADVTTLNLGGGFKVGRMPGEATTDLAPLSHDICAMLVDFDDRTGRKLSLEIEPGTFLAANAGSLVSRIQDISDTGIKGYTFLKLDTGMNDFMRPALHAAQHPMFVLNSRRLNPKPYVVVGHNCESSDLLTPAPGDSETLQPRILQEANIGDLVVIDGAGAYSSSMRLVGYNSFPSPNEVMVMTDGTFKLISRRQEVMQLTSSEVY